MYIRVYFILFYTFILRLLYSRGPISLLLVVLFYRFFPNIFGPTQDQPLDKEGSYKAFEELAQEVCLFS